MGLACSEHIDVRHHVICGAKNVAIRVAHIESSSQYAGVLAKGNLLESCD